MFVQLKKDYLGQKSGARVDVDDVVGKALIDQGVAEAMQGNPLQELMQKSMEGMLANLTDNLTKCIDGALKEFAQASTKSRKNAVPAIYGEGKKGDPNKSFGKLLLAIRTKNMKALEEMGCEYRDWSQDVEKKTAMSTQAGAQGGFLVPMEYHDELMTVATEESVVRKRATVIPMKHKTVQIPALDHVTAPSAGDSAFLGGVVARWTEEATSLNETEPNLKQIELNNYELSGFSKVSNTLIDDSALGLESLLYKLFGKAIAWYEDYAFIRGDGVGKPLGALTWPGLVSVSRSGASAIGLADVSNMFGRLLTPSSQKAVSWTIHPTVVTKLLQMTGGDNVIFIGNDVHGAPQWNILGYNAQISEKVPALNTAGDILLADWGMYLIGDRQEIEIAFSEHVAFLTNQTVWRFVSRVGGLPWLKDKITLADASSTLSPFVALAAG